MTSEYICHCFKHTQADLEEDARIHGKSTIMAQILAESSAGKCNCKTTNPKGK